MNDFTPDRQEDEAKIPSLDMLLERTKGMWKQENGLAYQQAIIIMTIVIFMYNSRCLAKEESNGNCSRTV